MEETYIANKKFFKCNKCQALMGDEEHMAVYKYKYCPYCGEKLEK